MEAERCCPIRMRQGDGAKVQGRCGVDGAEMALTERSDGVEGGSQGYGLVFSVDDSGRCDAGGSVGG